MQYPSSSVRTVALLCMIGAFIPTASAQDRIVAARRDVPVLYETDVVVAGGSSAAVAAACAAAGRGANVVLIAPRPYLGDDLCGQQHLWLEENESAQSELAKALFPDGRVTTPYTVKTALDQALLKHRVRYLTGCYATDLLLDKDNRPAGLTLIGRGGCQAVKAKVIIDATDRALLARQAGAQFRPFVPGERQWHFIIVGGDMHTAPGLTGRKLDVVFKNPNKSKKNQSHPVYEYTAAISMPDDTCASVCRAEHAIRDIVCGIGIQDWSEYAWTFAGDTIIAQKRLNGDWPGAAQLDVAIFRPAGASRLYVLSQHADVNEKAQPQMMRPLAWLTAGEMVGSAAAAEAAQLARPAEIQPTQTAPAQVSAITIGEPQSSSIAANADVVKFKQWNLPVLGRYDVVVVGGGTAGAPAGIAAARSGAKTLVVEYLHQLGGVGTAGLIGSYWYGMRGGFTQEIDDAITGKNRWPDSGKGGWNVLQKSEWLRRELLKAKADVWFGCFGCGAIVENGRVNGVLVATPFGCGVVLASTVVDSTGNADIADAAGAQTQFGVTGDGLLSVQLAGFPHRNLGDSVNNLCFTMVDDTSALDIWHVMSWSRSRYTDRDRPYDIGQLLDTRERRRIVADYMLTTPDILNHRTFPDTISQHKSNFDAAAFPTSPMLLVKDMKGPAFEVDLPYRSLLPRGLDGIIATGLGAGAERDAMTLVRMQADLQNQGYAAGLAAAMSAANGGRTRGIDIKKLQKQLIDKGALAAKVLTDRDSYPMSAQAIHDAVTSVGAMSSGIKQSRKVEDPAIFSLAVIMAHPQQSLPLLRAAHDRAAQTDEKLNYAKILGVLGDKSAAPTLITAIRGAADWDKGFGLTHHRESDNTYSDLDRWIIALGCTAAPDGLEVIIDRVKQLKPASELSHYNAVFMALAHYDRPATAIDPLVHLLNTPGFTGHAQTQPADPATGAIAPRDIATSKPDSNINDAFKELLTAGMLLHSGDRNSLARGILQQYAKDIHGHFARYAQYLLKETIAKQTP